MRHIRVLKWTIRSEVLRPLLAMERVQRLNGSGQAQKWDTCLRYSPAAPEREPGLEDVAATAATESHPAVAAAHPAL
jgi:hypothetical protein